MRRPVEINFDEGMQEFEICVEVRSGDGARDGLIGLGKTLTEALADFDSVVRGYYRVREAQK